MPDVTIVYWRDIPAQVIVGRGRSAVKLPLAERFEQAIDRAAMRSGLAGSDAYLGEWRRVPEAADAAEPQVAARQAADRLEAEHDVERLRELVENGGWSRAT
ncbi:virulence factor [Roseitranquillus sediminis]|uniref:virulence factor n=1 Tax=Roseitranquillus sediminis TaxID=2809051 RepID=UPI001D0C6E80|nr:virulence factor [Roseitranquillus sediminis]MBM9595578.1 virulence factor [Roseitranquillus sediminis]